MRIIYFSLDYTPHDHRFLSSLAETEHMVYYVRLQYGPRQTEDRPLPSKIEQVRWTGGQKPFAWRDLPGLIADFQQLSRKIKPDLVHAGPIQTCAFITAISGFHPLLTMSWGFDLMQDVERNIWWRWVTRYTLQRTDFFTSDAEITRQRAITHGMNPERTVVYPWGVDLVEFVPETDNKVQNTDAFTILCNRSWDPRYGVEILAHAFVKVAQQRRNISLMLLGGGSQESIIHKIFENGNVNDRVTFAGQVSHADLPRFYRMANLFISPSHVDGSSVTMLEALACGLPCLVSDIPANKEWITDGVNGWLFPDGNIDMLVASILRVYDHRNELFQIGQAARQTAEAKADWRINFAKLLGAYEQTVRLNA